MDLEIIKNILPYFIKVKEKWRRNTISYYASVLLLKKGLLGTDLHKVAESDLDFSILIIGAIQTDSMPDPEEWEPETRSEKDEKMSRKEKHLADTIGNSFK